MYHRITNHRIVGVGRDLCGSSSPALQPLQLFSILTSSSNLK